MDAGYPVQPEVADPPDAIADAAAQAYLSTAMAVFDAAATEAVERWYRIGDLTVRLRFANSALVGAMTAAFAHLAAPTSGAADLTILLLDTASTGIAAVRPWSRDDYLAHGRIRGYNTERFQTVYQHGVDAINLLDQQSNVGVFWARDAAAIPYYERSSPLRNLLHWWMSRRARQLVHGAAVGTAEGAALIVGAGGSGKSTSALCCIGSGLLYCGDDYALVAPDPEPRVYSLYCSGKLEPFHLRNFPHLLARVESPEVPEGEKVLLFADRQEDGVAPSLPLRAILVPRITGMRDTTVGKASPAQALRALAPSTLFQLPNAGAEALRSMAALVGRLPCHALNLGTDLVQIPGAIRMLLEHG